MQDNRKYLITFLKFEASAVCEYNEAGYLVDFHLTPGTFTADQYAFFFKYFPKNHKNIAQWKKGVKNVSIREIAPDLSFEAFYSQYDNKFGKKTRSMAIWKQMNDVEKAKAIAFIPKYKTHLITSGIQQKYAETYLNQQPWNN